MKYLSPEQAFSRMNEEKVNEDGHQDIASIKTQIEIAMSALTKMQISIDELPEDADLRTWWTNKVAIAVNKLDGMADYLDAKNVL